MSEQKFDPMTGQPINPANPGGFKFDPMTGKPINQTTTEGTIKFDPMTGQPVNQQVGAQPTYGDQNTTGAQQTFGTQNVAGTQPAFGGQDYSSQQSFGGQQGTFGYDPVAIEKANSDKNKKVAFVVLGVLAVAVVGLLIFGGVKLSKFVKDHKNQEVVENVEPEERTPNALPEEPVQKPEEPEQPQEPEVVEEEPSEEPAEEPMEQTPDEMPEEPSEEPAEETPKQTVATNRAGVDMNNLCAFQAGEYAYQLPEKVADFLEDGWTFNSEKEASQLIGAGAKEYMTLYYPVTDDAISVYIKNYSLDAQEARDCYVVEIDFNYIDAQGIGTISVMNGKAVIGETKEKDIVDLCGEPDRVSESSLGNSYYYYDPSTTEDDYSRPHVCISMSEEGVFDIVTISNDSEPTDFEQVEVSSEVPDYIYKYEAPKSLGNDPFSGNFELDGVVYNLPVPLQVLEADGWKSDADSDHPVGAGEGYVITMEKGNLRICIITSNFAEKATILENTMVINVSSDADGIFGNGIKFPAGLNVEMTETEFLAYLTKQNITNYDLFKETGNYTIPFDQSGNDRSQSGNRYEVRIEDGKVDSIEMTSYGWLRQ